MLEFMTYGYNKFSPTPYPLATIHPLQTDGQTMDDNLCQ